MAKYSGLESAVDGVTTANQDLYQVAKTKEGWDTYTPFRKVSFIPTSGDCHIIVNKDGGSITALQDIGWSEDNAQIDIFQVVEAGVEYVLSYRY